MRAVTVLLIGALAVTGCNKKSEEKPADAAPAAATPALQPAPAAAPAASESPDATAANDEKAAAIQAALAEDAIVSDPRGQWATSATASSTYAGDKAPTAKTSYSPFAATGAPNVERYSDNGNAWAPETADKGIEWLEVKFDKPVNATQIRIRQNYGAGAIIKVELVSDDGARHMVWQGVDAQQYTPDTISWFDRSFAKTSYKATGARITLATNAVSGWNEIDAVQLLGD
jgi:hypothetical protein